MLIKLNGKNFKTNCKNINSLKKELSIDNNYSILVNGVQIHSDIKLYSGVSIVFIKRNCFSSKKQYMEMMSSRYSKEIFKKIYTSQIAIAGLGGIGSNIAIMLARTGIGKLLLVDYDIVDVSNLNRQHYFIEHLGIKKTKALKEQIKKINPFVKVETKNIFINENNIIDIFKNYEIICEAFDNPQTKAMFINNILTQTKNSIVIASNGMAGYFSSNKIRTKKQNSRLYICGDLRSEVNNKSSLYATRVQICSAHMANMAIRLSLGIDKE